MKKSLIALLLLSSLMLMGRSMEMERNQVRQVLLEDNKAPSANVVERFLNDLKEDGSWPDIDYQDPRRDKWSPSIHLSRLWHLCLAGEGGNEKFRKALEFWVKNGFQCKSWWIESIGTPLRLGEIFLVVGDKVPKSLLEQAKPIFDRSKIDNKSTGQNRIWFATVALYKGLLYDDFALARKGCDIIAEEYVYAQPGKEGLLEDFSFHQHGPQLQFGNYGRHFLVNGLKNIRMFQGTELAMPGDKVQLLANYLLNGPRWTIYRKELDLNACARYIGKNTTRRQGDVFTGAAATLTGLLPESDPMRKDLAGLMTGDPEFSGNKLFYCSDFMVHRRPAYYLSIRMCSKRVIGSETAVNENMQGGLMGNGMVQLRRDNDEYRDIAPLFDWRRLPGITAIQDDSSLVCKQYSGTRNPFYNAAEFVGGLSDGRNGFTVQELEQRSLRGRKTVFCLDDYLVFMGSSIHSTEGKPVNSTVNSCYLRGEVSKDKNILHDNVEYIFPEGGNIKLETGEKTGRWGDVIGYEPKDLVKADLFTLFIDHGIGKGGYFYVIRPLAAETGPADYIKLITGSEDIHGIYDRKTQTAMIAFYVPGSAEVPGLGKITVPKPVCLMFTPGTVYVSDPTRKNKELEIRINDRQVKLKLDDLGKASSHPLT